MAPYGRRSLALKAAELAAANQLKIYTIGVGADEMIVRSFFW